MRSYVLDENIISDQPRFVKSGRSGGLHKKVVQITAVYAIIEWVCAGDNYSLFSLQLIVDNGVRPWRTDANSGASIIINCPLSTIN